MMLDYDSISGKRVFVTGADGFIGSHLTELLVRAGASVKSMVCYNSWNQKGWLSDLPSEILDEIEMYHADIRDYERVLQGISGSEYVFHLSSLVAIPYSYCATRSYVDVNVVGACNVLQSCRLSDDIVRLVHVSTSEVYGSAQYVPINETHPIVGQSPYAASKIAADKLAESYHLSFGLPVVTARPFNTFGPRQTARAVIPAIASQLLSGCKQLRLGSLSPTRDFNYVSDTARGMIALALCRAAEGKVVNIGSGEEWSIGQTAKLLMDIVGRHVPILCDDQRIRPEKSEVNRLVADNNLICSLTDWRSEVPFDQALVHTCDWIKENLSLFDINAYAR